MFLVRAAAPLATTSWVSWKHSGNVAGRPCSSPAAAAALSERSKPPGSNAPSNRWRTTQRRADPRARWSGRREPGLRPPAQGVSPRRGAASCRCPQAARSPPPPTAPERLRLLPPRQSPGHAPARPARRRARVRAARPPLSDLPRRRIRRARHDPQRRAHQSIPRARIRAAPARVAAICSSSEQVQRTWSYAPLERKQPRSARRGCGLCTASGPADDLPVGPERARPRSRCRWRAR